MAADIVLAVQRLRDAFIEMGHKPPVAIVLESGLEVARVMVPLQEMLNFRTHEPTPPGQGIICGVQLLARPIEHPPRSFFVVYASDKDGNDRRHAVSLSSPPEIMANALAFAEIAFEDWSREFIPGGKLHYIVCDGVPVAFYGFAPDGKDVG